MKCPKCSSDNLEKKFIYSHSEVSWRDGLGSPGTLTFKHDLFKCKNCGYEWQSVAGELQ